MAATQPPKTFPKATSASQLGYRPRHKDSVKPESALRYRPSIFLLDSLLLSNILMCELSCARPLPSSQRPSFLQLSEPRVPPTEADIDASVTKGSNGELQFWYVWQTQGLVKTSIHKCGRQRAQKPPKELQIFSGKGGE